MPNAMLNLSSWLGTFRLFLIGILILPLELFSQVSDENNSQHHEITIFVIPSLSRIDWANPSVLFKSSQHCFLNTLVQKNYYMIGHTIVRISSTTLPAPRYAAMCGKVISEKPDLVLIKKIGLGSLGATMLGHIEPEKSIRKGLDLYSKRNKVAYIKFRVGEQSIHRVLEFLDEFQRKSIHGFAPGDLYNGATWPRYENEGSGCSAFGMSVLDVANILPDESDAWRIHVKLPMDLIGGEFNNNKKISLSKILKAKSWYVGSGLADVDYVDYNVFDPSMIYEWIKTKRNQNDPEFVPDEENGVGGLIVDRRNVIQNPNEPIFLPRKDSNLFVKQYFRKLRNMK
jgi:hypothetical protein